MTTNKRHLPILVEMSVGKVQTARQALASKFESAVTSEARQAGLTVTCSPGCVSCCYQPVSVSIFEAIPIYRYLVRHRKWTNDLKKRLQETYEKQISVSREVWLLSLIPCPLLDENKRCSVYRERPLTCRTMLSVGDPYYCHPHNIGEKTEVIPREGVVDDLRKVETKVSRGHKLQIGSIPLSLALLLSERVCNGDLDIEAVDAEVMKGYAEHG